MRRVITMFLPAAMAVAACCLAAVAAAQDPAATDSAASDQPPAPPRQIDPEVVKLLEKVGALYRSADTLSAQVTSIFSVNHTGRVMEYSCVYEAQFRRPTLVAFRGRSGLVGADVIADGTDLYTFVPATNAFVQKTAPTRIDKLMSMVSNSLKMTGTPSGGMEAVAMMALFGEDPARALTDVSSQVEYRGVKTVDDQDLHVVRVIEQQGHIDFLIDTGEEPWVRRVEPDLAKLPKGVSESVKMTMSIRFDDWSTQTLPDDRFQFVAPPGAERKASLPEAMGLTPPPTEPDEPTTKPDGS